MTLKKKIGILFFAFCFQNNTWGQGVCGAFESIEGVSSFFSKVLLNDDGRAIVYSKKTSRKFTGKYSRNQGVIAIANSSFSLEFKFSHPDTLVGINESVQGKRFYRDRKASSFCENRKTQIAQNMPQKESSIAKTKNKSVLEYQEICGWFVLADKSKGGYYSSLKFNKDETIEMFRQGTRKTDEGNYSTDGASITVKYGNSTLVFSSLGADAILGVSEAVNGRKYLYEKDRSEYCKQQTTSKLTFSDAQTKEVTFSKSIIDEVSTIGVEKLSEDWQKAKAAESIKELRELDPTEKSMKIYEALSAVKKSNIKKAKSLFKECCTAYNDSRSCYEMGYLYELDRETSNAHKYYTISCDLGFGRACFALGKEKLKTKKKGEALTFFKKACSLGYTKSCSYISK